MAGDGAAPAASAKPTHPAKVQNRKKLITSKVANNGPRARLLTPGRLFEAGIPAAKAVEDRVSVDNPCPRDGLGDILLGPLRGDGQFTTARQVSRDRGRVSAARPARAHAPDERRAEQQLHFAVIVDVDRLPKTAQMAAFHERGATETRFDFARSVAHLFDGPDFPTNQN